MARWPKRKLNKAEGERMLWHMLQDLAARGEREAHNAVRDILRMHFHDQAT
jgi:hypothetical protein